MNKIIADESLLNQINGAKSPMTICDKEGKTLGHFVPSELYQLLMHDILNPPELTEEEIKRRLAEGPGKPLAQIWRELGRA